MTYLHQLIIMESKLIKPLDLTTSLQDAGERSTNLTSWGHKDASRQFQWGGGGEVRTDEVFTA